MQISFDRLLLPENSLFSFQNIEAFGYSRTGGFIIFEVTISPGWIIKNTGFITVFGFD